MHEHELRGDAELSLDHALARLSPCDLVLIEGFKAAPIPTLEVFRAGLGKPLLHLEDPHIVGIATDEARALPPATRLPVFALDDYDAIATFVDERAASHGVRR